MDIDGGILDGLVDRLLAELLADAMLPGEPADQRATSLVGGRREP